MKKNIVITGATGRLGGAFSNHFANSSKVRVFPVSTQCNEGLYSYETFLTDAFLQQTNVILHLAWSSVPKVSEERFGGEWLTDIPLLLRILEAIRAGGHTHIHFIFFSSAGTVYGKQDSAAATETTPCNPANMYGWAKLHAEQILQQFTTRFAMKSSILRISNVYGTSTRINEQQGVIPIIIKAALDSSEICVWGDGSARKDYLYVTDLIDAVDIIVSRPITGLFNVCFGQSFSLHHIIKRVASVAGNTIMHKYTVAPAWDNDHVLVDGGKFRKISGWMPRTNIEDGIKKTLEAILGTATDGLMKN